MVTARHIEPGREQQRAHSVAGAAVAAWHSNIGGGRIEVPLGVVSALALVSAGDGNDSGPAETLLMLDDAGFAALILDLWSRFALLRPDLLPRVRPLWRWLEEDPDEQTLRAAAEVGRAALRNGLIDLTGNQASRWSVDLMAPLLQQLRPESARKGMGQILTPLEIVEVMGLMLGISEGQTVHDPCAGTGTQFLGAAKAMRSQGLNPATCEWWANDIDWAAAACTAVNVHLWGLGMRVVIGCGDALLNSWTGEALASRQAAIDEVNRLWDMGRHMSAFYRLLGIEPPQSTLAAHLNAAQARMPKPPPPPPSHTFDPDNAFRQNRLF